MNSHLHILDNHHYHHHHHQPMNAAPHAMLRLWANHQVAHFAVVDAAATVVVVDAAAADDVIVIFVSAAVAVGSP